MTFTLSVGMIFGIIALIIAVLVILVLFMPVSYRLDGDIDEKKIYFKLRYLGFIRFRFSYDEDLEAVLKIFFIRLDVIKLLAKSRGKSKKKKKDSKKEERTALQKIKDGLPVARRIMDAVSDYGLIDAVTPSVKKFLFRARPRKINGRIGFGFSDPSVTGYITGVIAVLPVIYQTDLSVVPDFDTDETYIRGNIHAAGHMRLIALIILAVGLIRQKAVRALIGALRNKNK